MSTVSAEESFQIQFLQAQVDLRASLQGTTHPRKMLIQGLRQAMDLLGPSSGAVATISSGPQTAELLYSIPSPGDWNLGLINDYLKGRGPNIPRNLLVARVRRRARPWGAIALKFESESVGVRNLKALWTLADILSEGIEEYDDNRTRQLRRRIEHKVANRQDPKDLIYDILHGIRDLTNYSHSAALYIASGSAGPLELFAEQIAWTKAKSRRIGQKTEIDFNLNDPARHHSVCLFRRNQDGWHTDDQHGAPELARAIDSTSDPTPGVPEERAMLCALIGTPEGAIGVLKIASQDTRSLGPFEAMLVERLTSLASLSLQFLLKTEILEEQILQAERKYALANLTRGIAHDVNNALGSVLPLVQQIRHDTTNNSIKRDNLLEDLGHIESGLQTCRRIFSGMLACARSSDRSIGNGNLRRALDSVVSVMQNRFRRNAINLEIRIPTEMPAVRGNQGDVIQVFLNLLSNAADALPSGGSIEVVAHAVGDAIDVSVKDTGEGIPESIIMRVSDPFVTTKEHGNGLGLAICRSVMWEIGGEMKIDSEPGQGAAIHLRFPIDESSLQRNKE